MLKAEPCKSFANALAGSPIGLPRSVRDKESLPLLERDVHQQLVAFNVDNVAEGPLAPAREVEPDAAAPDAHVANAQMFQKFRQRRVYDVQFSPVSAGTDTQHRHQDEKYRARRPRLG